MAQTSPRRRCLIDEMSNHLIGINSEATRNRLRAIVNNERRSKAISNVNDIPKTPSAVYFNTALLSTVNVGKALEIFRYSQQHYIPIFSVPPHLQVQFPQENTLMVYVKEEQTNRLSEPNNLVALSELNSITTEAAVFLDACQYVRTTECHRFTDYTSQEAVIINNFMGKLCNDPSNNKGIHDHDWDNIEPGVVRQARLILLHPTHTPDHLTMFDLFEYQQLMARYGIPCFIWNPSSPPRPSVCISSFPDAPVLSSMCNDLAELICLRQTCAPAEEKFVADFIGSLDRSCLTFGLSESLVKVSAGKADLLVLSTQWTSTNHQLSVSVQALLSMIRRCRSDGVNFVVCANWDAFRGTHVSSDCACISVSIPGNMHDEWIQNNDGWDMHDEWSQMKEWASAKYAPLWRLREAGFDPFVSPLRRKRKRTEEANGPQGFDPFVSPVERTQGGAKEQQVEPSPEPVDATAITKTITGSSEPAPPPTKTSKSLNPIRQCDMDQVWAEHPVSLSRSQVKELKIDAIWKNAHATPVYPGEKLNKRGTHVVIEMFWFERQFNKEQAFLLLQSIAEEGARVVLVNFVEKSLIAGQAPCAALQQKDSSHEFDGIGTLVPLCQVSGDSATGVAETDITPRTPHYIKYPKPFFWRDIWSRHPSPMTKKEVSDRGYEALWRNATIAPVFPGEKLEGRGKHIVIHSVWFTHQFTKTQAMELFKSVAEEGARVVLTSFFIARSYIRQKTSVVALKQRQPCEKFDGMGTSPLHPSNALADQGPAGGPFFALKDVWADHPYPFSKRDVRDEGIEALWQDAQITPIYPGEKLSRRGQHVVIHETAFTFQFTAGRALELLESIAQERARVIILTFFVPGFGVGRVPCVALRQNDPTKAFDSIGKLLPSSRFFSFSDVVTDRESPSPLQNQASVPSPINDSPGNKEALPTGGQLVQGTKINTNGKATRKPERLFDLKDIWPNHPRTLSRKRAESEGVFILLQNTDVCEIYPGETLDGRGTHIAIHRQTFIRRFDASQARLLLQSAARANAKVLLINFIWKSLGRNTVCIALKPRQFTKELASIGWSVPAWLDYSAFFNSVPALHATLGQSEIANQGNGYHTQHGDADRGRVVNGNNGDLDHVDITLPDSSYGEHAANRNAGHHDSVHPHCPHPEAANFEPDMCMGNDDGDAFAGDDHSNGTGDPLNAKIPADEGAQSDGEFVADEQEEAHSEDSLNCGDNGDDDSARERLAPEEDPDEDLTPSSAYEERLVVLEETERLLKGLVKDLTERHGALEDFQIELAEENNRVRDRLSQAELALEEMTDRLEEKNSSRRILRTRIQELERELIEAETEE